MATGMTGLNTWLNNLAAAHEKIHRGKRAGLRAAGLVVRREAQTLTPVDWGNLKDSAYSDLDPIAARYVEVGYTAEYAPYVHEDLEARHTVGEAKFLQKAVARKRKQVLEIMAKASRVGR